MKTPVSSAVGLALLFALAWCALQPSSALASCGDYARPTWRLKISISPLELPPIWAGEPEEADVLADDSPFGGTPRCSGPLCGQGAPAPEPTAPPRPISGERTALTAVGNAVCLTAPPLFRVPLRSEATTMSAHGSIFRPPR